MWKNGRLTRVLSVSDGKISSSYGTKLASRNTVLGALLYDLKQKMIILNFQEIHYPVTYQLNIHIPTSIYLSFLLKL